jgi:tryptophan 2,3-dioxygenase
MKDGMEVDQYNKFRHTLTPASGFQSAQYRFIEFASTDVINLIDARFRKDFNVDISVENTINHLYWQAAGKDYQTGQKSYLLEQFEKRYHHDFVAYIQNYQHKNLWQKYLQLTLEEQQNETLIQTMRHFDYTVNITWVMGHYQAAKKYIESSYGNGQATGGSNWKKYMLPKYQKRIFFPQLWTEEERNQWGIKESEAVES